MEYQGYFLKQVAKYGLDNYFVWSYLQNLNCKGECHHILSCFFGRNIYFIPQQVVGISFAFVQFASKVF